MRVLLIKHEQQSKDILSFYLESQFCASVIQVNNVQEALDFLLEDQTVDLVICNDDEKSTKIIKFLTSTEFKIPCILIQNPAQSPINAFPEVVIGLANSQNLLSDIEKSIQLGFESGRLNKVNFNPEYCRIKTSLLVRVVPLKANIYIRLSNIKYVMLFQKGDTFNAKDLELYLIRKKIEYLYLKSDETGEFIDKLKKELETLVKQENLQPVTSKQVAGSIHELVRELGNSLGFTPEVQEVAKQGVRFALHSIGGSPRLSQILKLLSREPDKYITSHSLAVAQVACGISAAFDWPSGTTFQKLVYAAFFHDIVFTNQTLCSITNLDELESKKGMFTAEEIRIYKNHPILASDIIKKFHEVPSDVDLIILQHHEKADGSGFPKKIQASYISPLTCIFIIAHDLVNYLYRSGLDADVEKFLKEYREKYSFGTFKRVLAVIEKKRIEGLS